MSNLQFSGMQSLWARYKFRPSLLGALLLICMVPLFIKLGLWQYNKAQQRQALQAVFEQYRGAEPVELPKTIEHVDNWKYRAVKLTGEYLPQYQILLDNQLNGERVGYHVLTPLLNDQQVVLIDRGWVAALPNHVDIPKVETPTGKQSVFGWVWVPSQKFYTLESSESTAKKDWQAVWQNMDMKKYQSVLPYALMPIVIRLSQDSAGGGYDRQWQAPDDKSGMNLSYAYQWFGFAFAAVGIYLFVSFKRIEV